MITKTSYMSSKDYIQSLKFDYIETYSLQRGAKYDGRIIHDPEYKEFQQLKAKRAPSKLETLRSKELNKLYESTQYLVDSDGIFHPSAEKTGTYSKDHSLVLNLIDILNIKINHKNTWMCAPVYRDAIVFYNSNKAIISVLNVCLSCEHMETKMSNYIESDSETYQLMKKFFLSIGHKVKDK